MQTCIKYKQSGLTTCFMATLRMPGENCSDRIAQSLTAIVPGQLLGSRFSEKLPTKNVDNIKM